MTGYDIIGDVHGCAGQLEELLTALGYQINGATGEYRHPSRRAIFVGDLIDRGDEQLRVLEIVKAMVDADSTLIVMGNHEFNALAYATESPTGSGKFLRPHDDPDNEYSEKNAHQHRAFLDQVTGTDRERYLQWFTTIPMWLDLGGVRVVHACWQADSVAFVEQHYGSTPFTKVRNLVEATDRSTELYRATETLLKGPEISLVDHGQPPYHDKDGHSRDNARLQWWNSDARTLRELAEMGGNFITGSGEPYPALPELEVARGETDFVYRNEVPVFYGHYWRQGLPKYLHDWTDYTACVDFSAVKDGALTAYRWSGERKIDPAHYVSIAATGTYQLLGE